MIDQLLDIFAVTLIGATTIFVVLLLGVLLRLLVQTTRGE